MHTRVMMALFEVCRIMGGSCLAPCLLIWLSRVIVTAKETAFHFAFNGFAGHAARDGSGIDQAQDLLPGRCPMPTR